MVNYWDKNRLREQALKTKKKWEQIVLKNEKYPCHHCRKEKPADQFVIQYMKNQLVGKYRYLYECKACKRKRTYQKREDKRKTIVWALEIIIKHLYQWAKKRNLSFNIEQKDLLDLREKQAGRCYYTNYPMTFNFIWHTKGKLNEKTKFQVSCDRIDNNVGYIKSNIVLCCTFINKMKWTLSEQEFYKVCQDIVDNQKKQNRKAS